MSLLNKEACRRFVLERAKALRPGCDFTRVSSAALARLEHRVERAVDAALKQEPSRYRTIDLSYLDLTWGAGK